MTRTATAVWQGSLKEGAGTLTTQSKTLNGTDYSFGRRFGEDPGTNPEELVAAAHSGCFAMAFSAMLGEAGFTPTSIEATAHVELEFIDGKPTVTKSHIVMNATIPGISEEQFHEVANGAKAGCPISRLLNAEISLSATLNA